MKLAKRLTTVASLIPPHAGVGDIGADRGELSYYLLENSIIDNIILSDISMNALNRAEALFKDTPYFSKVDFRLGSGLTVLEPHEVEYVVLAGMGGQSIVNIFEECPKIAASLKGMIVQAMGNTKAVRRYLASHNFAITAEEMILEDGHYYTIIKAERGKMELSETEIYGGPLLIKESHPIFKEYLKEQMLYRQNLLAELVAKNKAKHRQEVIKTEIEFIENIQRGMK
ncbi:MAG: class I SAM-dependent methyltransferase [Clostridiales bacterium]